MLDPELDLIVRIRTGDVPAAREMIAGGAAALPGRSALRHCVTGDRPGMARMLAAEGAIDVGSVCLGDDDRLLGTEHVLPELLCCGMDPEPVTAKEKALHKALTDSRAAAAAAAVMMKAAFEDPGLYERLQGLAGMLPSGLELLDQACMAAAQSAASPSGAGTGDTPATR